MKLRFALFFIALQLINTPATAQLDSKSAENPAVEVQRDRIGTQRAEAEGLFTREKAACYQRFAVNDCIREADTRRRGVLADLRRQEVSINDSERKRKGAEQVQQTEVKSGAGKQQEQADKRANALQAEQDRQDNAAQKQQVRKDKQGAEPGKQAETVAKNADAKAKTVARAQKTLEAAERSKAQAAKLKDAAQKRADAAQRLREKNKPPSAPLPARP